MKTFLLTFLGVLAGLVFFFVLIPLAVIGTVMPAAPAPVNSAVLEIDLREEMPDQPASDGLNALLSGMSHVELLLSLHGAENDPKVKGVFIRASEFGMSSSRAEEIRSAILRLKAKGKFVIAHSQGFFASGPAAYRAISAADEIWIQPGVDFETPGIGFESLFFGDALRRINVDPEFEQFYEYKGAVDVYEGTGFTGPNEEATRALAERVWVDSLTDIETDRKAVLQARAAIFAGGSLATPLEGLDAAQTTEIATALRTRFAPSAAAATAAPAGPAAAPSLRTILEESPFTSEEAVVLGLADRLGWPEDAADAAIARAQGELVWIGDYTAPQKRSSTVIALVGGEGAITTGWGGGGVFDTGSAVFASDRVADDLLALVDDETVDAVVFRVDSPGGSSTASDQVWRAVERLQEAGKPVVVSMGSMAASGGYYVSAGAKSIVANRSTITGSIGVYGGKFAVGDGLRMLGVSPDTVAVGGEQTTAWGMERLTNSQRTRIAASLEDVYVRFTSVVAEGRSLTRDQVHEVAKGRIWSGADALDRKLVDKTGGLIEAIEEAKRLGGAAPDDPVQIRLDVRRASPLELLQGFMVSAQAGVRDPAAFQALAALARDRRAAAALKQVETDLNSREPMLVAPILLER